MQDTDVELVIKALENPNYQWRTVDGLSKETGLPREKIVEVVSALPGQVIRAADLDEKGRPLFTTRRHYRRSSSTSSRILSVLGDKNR